MRFPGWPRYRPGWRAVMVATTALGLAGATGYFYWQSPPTGIEPWLHAEIVELSDEELEPWLAGLLERRGEGAIPLVVGDLAANRPAVRRAALDVLRREIDRWERSSIDASRKATAMAEALRDLPATTRATAGSELATRLLAWADRPNTPAATRGEIRVVLAGLRSLTPIPGQTADVAAPLIESNATAAQAANQGTLPVEIGAEALSAANLAATTDTSASPAVVTSPRLLPPVETGPGANGADESWELTPLRTGEAAETPSPETVLPAAPVPNAAEELAAVPGTATRQLIAGLHGERGEEFIQELRRRGFDTASIELAEHLSSSDVKERLQWTSALPQIPKIDARAWLTWMTEDTNAEVRRTAVTLLATSLDEPTLTLLRRLEVRDPDPSVRRLAGELIRRK